MNFNFGEILARAWQIAWRHKVLWIAGIIVSLVGLISAAISLAFNQPFSFMEGTPEDMGRSLAPILLSNGLTLIFSILSIPISVLAMMVPSLGTIQAEKGNPRLDFIELFRASLPYFWRVLGIFLVIWVGMFVVVGVFMGCMVLLSIVTLGLGTLCMFPMMLVLIPLAIAVYAGLELGMSAVLVDNLDFSTAIRRAWELTRKNIGAVAILSVIIYLISMIIGMVIAVPMMVPMFGFIFNMGAEPDMQAFERLFRNMTIWMLAFSPLYAILQGFVMTFMQSAWTLTYMRLVSPQDNVPAIVEANA